MSITVKLFDGTTLQFPDGTDQAVIARVAKEQTAAIKAKTTGAEVPQYAPNGVPMNAAAKAEIAAKAKAGTLSTSPESLAGSEAMTGKAEAAVGPSILQEIMRGAGDTTLAAGTGLARGAMEAVGFPGSMADLGEAGARKVAGLLGMDATKLPEGVGRMMLPGYGRMLPSGAEIRAGASDLTGGVSEYDPQTTVGDFVQTGASFLGGGATPKVAALAGLLSEGGGKLSEGSELEPYVRFAGGVLGSILGMRPGKFLGAADDEAARMANVTSDAGVRGVTKGQATGSEALMRMEGRLNPSGGQMDDATAVVMGRFGTGATKATPPKLVEIETKLVKDLNDPLQGVDIVPTPANAAAAKGVVKEYIASVKPVELTPKIKNVADEIAALAKKGMSISLEQLDDWRSKIGRLTTSVDNDTREAAHALRGLIDDMTDDALRALGRDADIPKLAAAREGYRDFLAVADASTRSGSRAGVLSMQDLNQAMIRAQGRRTYAMGRGTEMTDFVRSAAQTLRPASTVSAGGVRAVQGAGGLLGAATGIGGSMGGPATLGLAALGLAAPPLFQAAMRSNAMQSLLRSPVEALSQASRSAPGLLAQ